LKLTNANHHQLRKQQTHSEEHAVSLLSQHFDPWRGALYKP